MVGNALRARSKEAGKKANALTSTNSSVTLMSSHNLLFRLLESTRNFSSGEGSRSDVGNSGSLSEVSQLDIFCFR